MRWRPIIAMTLHGCQDFPNRTQRNCWVNRSFRYQIKYQSAALLTLCEGYHLWPVYTTHKEQVMPKAFPYRVAFMDENKSDPSWHQYIDTYCRHELFKDFWVPLYHSQGHLLWRVTYLSISRLFLCSTYWKASRDLFYWHNQPGVRIWISYYNP